MIIIEIKVFSIGVISRYCGLFQPLLIHWNALTFSSDCIYCIHIAQAICFHFFKDNGRKVTF